MTSPSILEVLPSAGLTQATVFSTTLGTAVTYEYRPPPSVVFVVMTRNSSPWIEACLESILRQHGDGWRCLVTDDASTDDTWQRIARLRSDFGSRMDATRRSKRQWKAANFHRALASVGPREVVVELDGDDALTTATVHEELRALHTKYDLVWTQHALDAGPYSSWHFWPSTPIPDRWSRSYPRRETIWTRPFHPGHLRTHKGYLYRHIREEDFKLQGQWLRCCFDSAYYTALLELTPLARRYFYDRVCCRYRVTDQNDTFTDKRQGHKDPRVSQSRLAVQLMNLPRYERLRPRSFAVVVNDEQEWETTGPWLLRAMSSHPEDTYFVGIFHGWNTASYRAQVGAIFVNMEVVLAAGPERTRAPMLASSAFASVLAIYVLGNFAVSQCELIEGPRHGADTREGPRASVRRNRVVRRRDLDALRAHVLRDPVPGSPFWEVVHAT